MMKPETEQTGKDVKSQFKPIAEADLQTLAGTGSFGRGLKYFRSNYITDAILRGDTLYAQCYGSQAAAYRLSATLVRAAVDENMPTAAAKQAILIGGVPITAYACECEAGGFCKHLVALLLTWLNKPESIGVRAEFAVRLQAFSQEQLLKLCLKLLERQPDMEYLIDVVPPPVTPSSEAGSDASGGPAVSPLANARTVDVNAIRRRVQKAFQQGGRGYDEYYGRAERIAEELQPLMETGGEYAEAGQWANAQAIYETIALEAIEEYEDTDDEGDLSNLVNNCCDGLAGCLDAQAALPEAARLDANARHQLIQSLYKVWEYDRHMGGIGLANDAQEAIARNVTPTERAEVETWLQSGMKPGTDFSSNFNNGAYARFLVALKVHSGISDEEKLAEYRKHGLYTQITDLLLAMGRVDEAMQTALEETPTQMQLTAFAGKLLNHGR